MLTEEQIHEFKQILEQRYQELWEEIQHELKASRNERFIDLAGQVHDLEDLSVADLLVDIEYAKTGHLIKELKEVEDALKRIRTGSYGICIDTGEPIELERLRACPTAKRTTRAQQKFEKTFAAERHASL